MPTMVKSNLVWIGKTIDGINVWTDPATDDGKLDFCTTCEIKIDGGTMTWNCVGTCGNNHTGVSQLQGADIDEETLIVIAWPTTTGYTFEKVTEETFFEYAAEYGWNQMEAFAQFDDDYCSELILIVDDDYDVTEDNYEEDNDDTNDSFGE